MTGERVFLKKWQTAAYGESKMPSMIMKFNKNPVFTIRVSA
jgi:hypothetical protein